MQYIGGFDAQILESLENALPDIAYEAILAAGNWELNAAWVHISTLVADEKTEKYLLLAAIESAGSIRPKEAHTVLGHLLDSDDEDVVETAMEALAIAEGHGNVPEFGEEEEEHEDDFPR
jgi:HEAT repeat protein